MDPFVSKKIQDLLCKKYDICVYKIIGMFYGFCKSYDAHIYFKTNEELSALTDEKKEEIESIYIGYLQENGYMPDEIEEICFRFDSDENVQLNYGGNYFHATRA